MEPHATIARWDGRPAHRLRRDAGYHRHAAILAGCSASSQDNVHVVSPFVGGGFGCRAHWPHAARGAGGARRGRPVKLVLTRGRRCSPPRLPAGDRPKGAAGRRPARAGSSPSTHTIHLDRCGRLSTASHRTGHGSDRNALRLSECRDRRIAGGAEYPGPVYARARPGRGQLRARNPRSTSCPTRLQMDPLELRLRNYAEMTRTGPPWSSKALRECYASARETFGWAGRPLEPRSMRDGNLLVGWGMARRRSDASLPGHGVGSRRRRHRARAHRRARPRHRHLHDDDAGRGRSAGLAVERVQVELGDSRLPAAPVSGGSMTVVECRPGGARRRPRCGQSCSISRFAAGGWAMAARPDLMPAARRHGSRSRTGWPRARRRTDLRAALEFIEADQRASSRARNTSAMPCMHSVRSSSKCAIDAARPVTRQPLCRSLRFRRILNTRRQRAAS